MHIETNSTTQSCFTQLLRAKVVLVLRNDYSNQACSVARTLEVVGERWTLLVIRDAFCGLRRFDEFQASTGVARNVLTSRLERLFDHGILEKRAYQERPPRFEYLLTDKGRDLWPVIFALMQWGDQYDPWAQGPPTLVAHRGCGGNVGQGAVCDRCGEVLLNSRDMQLLPGPGAPADHPLLRAAARQEALTG